MSYDGQRSWFGFVRYQRYVAGNVYFQLAVSGKNTNTLRGFNYIIYTILYSTILYTLGHSRAGPSLELGGDAITTLDEGAVTPHLSHGARVGVQGE